MCASIKNPLQRDGTSQQQRLAKALLPENAKIDDRKIEEIIAFALEYSRLINYYNAGNTIDGDWSCFYDNDPCVLFALLATTDTDSIEAEFKALQEKIQPGPARSDCDPDPVVPVDQLPRYFDDIINLIYSVAIRIHEACKKLGNGNLLKEEIITIIKSDLHLAIIDNAQQDALIKLISYDKASIEPGNDYSPFIHDDNSCTCTKAWQLDQEGYDCIFPDDSFDLASLKNLFYLFFVALLKIKRRAKIYFEECIEKNDSHQPHVTLFLAFFYLFQNAIDHLNSLTGSHLRYYLEKILCLHKKAATPDKVHIIFELAKNFDTHLVEEGVLLNAGKEDGRQMVYSMLEEIVVNKAKVEKIKSIYIDEKTGLLHAAPVADTKDGLGEAFSKEESPFWRSLGGVNGPIVNEIDNPSLETGFALASPMFFLKEGFRGALISYKLDKVALIKENSFRLLYSSEKEWIEIENFHDAVARLLKPYINLQKIYDAFKDKIQERINKGFDIIKTLYEDLYTPGSAINNDLTFEALGKYFEPEFTDSVDTLAKDITTEIETLKNNGTKIDDELMGLLNDVLATKHIYLEREDLSVRKELDFFILANTTAAPFTPLKTDEKNPGISSKWPIIKTLIKNVATVDDKLTSQYTTIKDLKVTGVDIKVLGYGLKDLVVQNDNAILDNSKEIQPFTNVPYPGSYFYIGSKEAFQKKLDFVGVELQWANKNPDLVKLYENYTIKEIKSEDQFKVDAELLNGGIYKHVTGGISQKLFDKNFLNNNTVITLGIDHDEEEGQKETPVITQPTDSTPTVKPFGNQTGDNSSKGFALGSLARDPYMPDFADYNTGSQRGFMRLMLTPQDFLHREYPLEYTAKVASAANGVLDPKTLPSEPYTPKLKNTSLFYLSSERTLFGPDHYNATIEQFYHITPFGYDKNEIDKEVEVYLLPQFKKASEPTPQEIKLITAGVDPLFTQGNMYIGLKDAKPEQKVNILFQVLDGSGDNRYSPPDIEWDYLIENEWQPFKPSEIQDHTRADESSKKSLLKSGIIEFILPREISSKKTTILDPAFLWIRACAHEDPIPADPDLLLTTQRIAALPDLVAVIAQAGIAEFQNNNNTLTHLAAPLPAKTISKFMDSRAAIKTVSQPYNSFDGQLPENNHQFYRRISERLRHKNRAICIWDYERLVLDKFPSLYKVKCLNHTNILQNKEIAPGFVSISVIPDLRNRNAADKIEPRVPVGMLDEIKAFLKEKTNLFVASPNEPDYLQVVNPLYEPIKISCCVRFYEGYDPAYYKYVLNTDLRNFLAPWANNANSEISFGSVYHKSAILNFIERRKYIDVVLGFKAEHFTDDLILIPGNDADRISPTTSRSILTSYKNEDIVKDEVIEHDITFVPYDTEDPCPPCAIATTA